MDDIRKPYAITNHAGDFEYIGLHTSEDDCWLIYLGWPRADEIEMAKARGLSCHPVIVTREPTEE